MSGVLGLLKRNPALYNFLRYDIYARLRSKSRQKIFGKIFNENLWDDQQSLSGPGSSLTATVELRASMPQLWERMGIRSLLDIPCGDVVWMRHIASSLERYVGADLVPELVKQNRARHGAMGEFVQRDLLRDPLPKVDAVFCRDCLVHLSNREVLAALRNVARTDATYFLSTTFPGLAENRDTVTPYWCAINLQVAPYNLPEPQEMLLDFSPAQRNDQGKYLAVWRIADLRG
jgi:hypothetical protein